MVKPINIMKIQYGTLIRLKLISARTGQHSRIKVVWIIEPPIWVMKHPARKFTSRYFFFDKSYRNLNLCWIHCRTRGVYYLLTRGSAPYGLQIQETNNWNHSRELITLIVFICSQQSIVNITWTVSYEKGMSRFNASSSSTLHLF
jgi:hypothetical protein